jgi:Cu(I)/Ag(I) efflux system protein CusF
MKHLLSMIVVAMLPAIGMPGLALATSHENSTKSGQQTTLTEGEVRKVDKETRKLTIRHGPLENLGMPAMTMVFQVKDASMLDAVKPGDKVKFVADKEGGSYMVTHMEILK